MVTKFCTRCSTEYPATTEYFYKDCNRKGGLQCWCKTCQKLYRRSEKAKASYKRYRRTEKGKISSRRYHEKHYATIKGHLRYIFNAMRRRCGVPNDKAYKWYGGRGIRCLFSSAEEFINYVVDVLQVDPHGLTVDRINNDGNYEEGNIRFVTHAENQRNKNRRGR